MVNGCGQNPVRSQNLAPARHQARSGRQETRDEATVIYQTAECLRQMHRYHEALLLCGEGIELHPERAELHFLLGTIFLDLGRLEEAEQAFLTCLEKGQGGGVREGVPGAGSYLAHFHLGQIYEMKGRMDQASLHYCQAAREGLDQARLRASLLGRGCTL